MCRTTAVTAAVVLLALPASAAGAGARTANDNAEVEMTAAINEVRAKHGLHALRESRSLARSAGRFSLWLMEKDMFGHAERIRASGRFAMLGEALAMHQGRSFDVRGTLRRWLESPPHRALVLSPTMQWSGTGVTRGYMGEAPTTLWVLHLGRVHLPGAGPSLPAVPAP